MSRPALYPETVVVKVMEGWKERIDASAADADMSPSEWIRWRIRTGLLPPLPSQLKPTLEGAEARRFEEKRAAAKLATAKLLDSQTG